MFNPPWFRTIGQGKARAYTGTVAKRPRIMVRMSPPIARLLRIRGRVQGVCYRASMVDEAARLGLHGWVRNRSDGSVEALAQGDSAAVQALIDWAQRGPAQARVDSVAVSEAETEGASVFAQRPTF